MERIPKIFTYEMHQDDPSKCTSAKMRKLGFAQRTSRGSIAQAAIVLNPAGTVVLSRSDIEGALRHGLVVIDCSWERAEPVFKVRFRGEQRRLPALVAGNPTNYSRLGRLSSVESAAAALIILGYKSAAERILSIYKWGETFLALNSDLLGDYQKATTVEEIRAIELQYFP